MVSIRYFCGVGEFCSTKSKPRGDLVSSSDTGAATIPRAMQKKMRDGIRTVRAVAGSNFGSLAASITRPLLNCTPEGVPSRGRTTLGTSFEE